jgi:hypothetical protein
VGVWRICKNKVERHAVYALFEEPENVPDEHTPLIAAKRRNILFQHGSGPGIGLNPSDGIGTSAPGIYTHGTRPRKQVQESRTGKALCKDRKQGLAHTVLRRAGALPGDLDLPPS